MDSGETEDKSLDAEPPTDEPPQDPPSQPKRPIGLPFRAPAAPALRQVRELEKALRPLTRKVPSPTAFELDEVAMVEQAADCRDWWVPVVRPAAERWLDVALVVEDSPAITLWERVIEDWQALLGRVGAFRDVRVWSLQSTAAGTITIAPRTSSQTAQGRSVSPKQLIDPSGRRLILFMSDCTSALWRAEPLQDVLKTWAASGSLALVQLLPERLWRRTALVAGYGVQLSATLPGQASDRLVVSGLPVWEEVETAGALRLPVVTIEPGPLARWARMVAGAGDAPSAGVLFEPGTVWRTRVAAGSDQPDPEAIVRQFWAVASPLAKELAGYLAAVPVSLDVLHLIQAALLPESSQVHAAEVFMGGLIERVGEDAAGLPVYDFREGVRSWLVGSMPRSQTEKVLDAVSEQIAERLGLTPKGFKALLFDSTDLPEEAISELQVFARITKSTLLRMGGELAALGDVLDPEIIGIRSSQINLLKPPTLSPIEFEEGYLDPEAIEEDNPEATGEEVRFKPDPEPPNLDTLTLETFAFETAFATKIGNQDLAIQRTPREAQRFTEHLTNTVALHLIAVSGGSFLMGSSPDEPERYEDESPRHTVNVPEFLMGQFPITQNQWQVIAALPKIEIDLPPNPSRFSKTMMGGSADQYPVECVSWHEAIEACARLAQATGKPYRLPSEAEWEYACRATTVTVFNFGSSISSDLANYGGHYSKTTEVGNFPANFWGLYDMHGNVWEWCQDYWNANYNNTPADGSPAIISPRKNLRLLRGVSWYCISALCRSATRYYSSPMSRNINIGFRVCCSVAGTS